ncbi:MAG: hypothetical protein JWN34_3384 [Bryobacterales bacterium]|nr:hypothetical protein [Bryobacterales bacterium]
MRRLNSVPRQISSYDKGLEPGRPDHRDIVAGLMRAAARLVADDPRVWKSGAHSLVAGGVGDQPPGEEFARRRFERSAERELTERVQHCDRGCRVARIAWCRFVEVGLITVESSHRVAHFTQKPGEGRGAAKACEQQIGGRVIADSDGGGAKVCYRHAVAADVQFRDGCVRENVAF